MAAKDLMAAAGVLYCLSLVRISTTFVSVAPEPRGAISARPWVVTASPAADASLLQLGLRSVAAALAVGAAASRLAALKPRGGRGQAAPRVVACAAEKWGQDRPDVDPNTLMMNRTGMTAPSNALICYCEALASIAEKQGEQIKVAADVMKLNDMLMTDAFELKCEEVMNNWFAPPEGIVQMICEELNPTSTVLPKFLEVTAKRGRATDFADIMRGYIELNYTVAKVQVVRCISASPLSDAQKATVTEAMKRRTGCAAIKLICEMDGSLGAGLKLNWDFLDTETPAQPQTTLNLSLSSKVKKIAAGEGVLLEGTEALSLSEDLALV